MPACAPCELDLMSIVERLGDIQRKYNQMEREAAKTKDSVNTPFDLHYQTNSYAAKANSVPQIQVKLPDTSKSKHPISKTKTEQPNIASGLPLQGSNINDNAQNMFVHNRVSKFVAEQINQTEASSIESDGEPFQKSSYERRKLLRQKRRAIYGTATHGTLRGAQRTVDLFVFRLEKDTETKDVEDYLREHGLDYVNLRCVSNEESRFKSYKLTTDHKDSEQVLDASFWPNGVGCRKFISRRMVGGSVKPSDE